MSDPNTPQNNPEQDPQSDQLGSQAGGPSEEQSPSANRPLEFEAPSIFPDPATQKLPTSPPDQPPRVAPDLQEPTVQSPFASSSVPSSPGEPAEPPDDDPWSSPAPTVGGSRPSQPGEDLWGAVPQAPSPTTSTRRPVPSSGQGLTLKVLLDRPNHRWMVPAGLLIILGAFGLIGFVAVQADADLSSPVPEVSETK